MPPRPHNNGGFNTATLFQVGVIPILTSIAVLGGFYYITKDTLARHDKEISTIEVEAKVVHEQENKDREKVRGQYLEYQNKTNEILGKLDTRLAVSETKQETANQTLNKIADELARISANTFKR